MKKPKRYEFFCVLDYSEVQKLAAKSWKFLHRYWDIGIFGSKMGLMVWRLMLPKVATCPTEIMKNKP